MTAINANILPDATVRLEPHSAENTHTLVLKPYNGGGLLLWNSTQSQWVMKNILTDGGAAPGAYGVDVYNATIDGVGSSRAKRYVNSLNFQSISGPRSGWGDITITQDPIRGGKVSHVNSLSPSPMWWAGWSPRYLRGDSLGEKLYWEQTCFFGGFSGLGVMVENQSSPLPPFNGNTAIGPGTTGVFVYWDGAIWSNGAKIGDLGQGGIYSGDTIGIALDCVNNKVWIKNIGPHASSWNGNPAADPATNVGGIDLSLWAGLRIVPIYGFWAGTGGSVTPNFNGGVVAPFIGATPAGFTKGWRVPQGQMYDVFVYDAGGANSIGFDLRSVPQSGTNIAIDSDTGIAYKAGDLTRRLVGRFGLVPDSNETGFQVPGADYNAMVISFLNPRERELFFQTTQGQIFPQYSAGGMGWLGTANGPVDSAHFVTFGDADGVFQNHQPHAEANIFMFGGGGSYCYGQVGINDTFISTPTYAYSSIVNIYAPSGAASMHCGMPGNQFNKNQNSYKVAYAFNPVAAAGSGFSFEATMSVKIWE